jgi:hypothetical protein
MKEKARELQIRSRPGDLLRAFRQGTAPGRLLLLQTPRLRPVPSLCHLRSASPPARASARPGIWESTLNGEGEEESLRERGGALRVRHDPAVSTYTRLLILYKKKEQTGKAIIISRIIFEQGADRNTYT